ncbi:MAG: ribonuclease R [Oscillospiraceae bacterium]
MSLQKQILQSLKMGPLTIKQIKALVKADSRKIEKALKKLSLANEIKLGPKGYEQIVKKGRAAPAKNTGETVLCKFVKLGRTFGFAQPLDGSGDVFIPGKGLNGAMPGDKVQVSLFAKPRVPGSREGAVVSVEEPYNRVVGTIQTDGKRLYIVPDNARETAIFIKKNQAGGLKPGEKVGAEIIERGPQHENHRAKVVLRFGMGDSAKEAAEAIIYAAGLEPAFPPEVLAEAVQAPPVVAAGQAEGCKDLRRAVVFTIDSASTKDIDDAISAKKTKTGYELGVHIADVSHYVRPKSLLDAEAFKRGTSVYYAESVIPMLPQKLSNGICSLNEKEDRLAFSCLMKLDNNAVVKSYSFEKSIIKSKVKGVYSEINDLFDKGKQSPYSPKYTAILGNLEVIREIYQKLSLLREQRGSLEIDTDEAKLVIDDKGLCVGVEKHVRGDAEKMIEEFMLLANSSAANLATAAGIPFVYRVHEKPMEDRAEQLKLMLKAAGIDFSFKAGVPTQQELGVLLNQTRGTGIARFVHTAVLRSMAKAKYEPLAKGHYGLALEDYAHFTSPIRRYPDLAIHRILTDVVSGVPKKELQKRYKNFADTASLHSSEAELTAQRVERSCDSSYKAEYMRQFIGETFSGIISSVTQFGVYVELPNTVEGMVHVSRLAGDHFDLTEGVALTNPGTGVSYRIGDGLTVVLVGVDIAQGHIDFDLENHFPAASNAVPGKANS